MLHTFLKTKCPTVPRIINYFIILTPHKNQTINGITKPTAGYIHFLEWSHLRADWCGRLLAHVWIFVRFSVHCSVVYLVFICLYFWKFVLPSRAEAGERQQLNAVSLYFVFMSCFRQYFTVSQVHELSVRSSTTISAFNVFFSIAHLSPPNPFVAMHKKLRCRRAPDRQLSCLCISR